ncbi:carboxymuconolactone decarboxylase family protein [Thalassobaculum sp.]|uniref:carboxymuconolactone decarboxylase family protein n=1 Tax=Thalassobaculum sp. TaxID=2022740 RepID=UPI0032EFE906
MPTQTDTYPDLGSGRLDAGPRFERDDRRTRDRDLLPRDLLTAEERFAVRLAGLAALPLDGAVLSHAFGALLADGMAPGFAEDILVQMAAYLGYPRAAKALDALRRAGPLPAAEPTVELADLADPTDEERYRRGTGDYARINATALETIQAAFGELAGDLVRITFRSFGDVFASSRQPLPVRQLATVAALGVLGGAAPQLRFHIAAALHVGVTRDQLVEAIVWVQYLAGMPAAYNALVELKGALAAGADAPPAYR